MADNTIAYGFLALENLFAQRVAVAGYDTVYNAVVESAAEHTRNMNALMSLFSFRTVEFAERWALPGVGTLQPLDEFGNPKPVQEGGYFDVGYPIQGGGTAWGTTRLSRAKLTVEEANRITIENMKRDQDWLRRHLLAAIFDNAGWTYDDQDHGNLSVKGLANNTAGEEYVFIGGTKGIDNHYLAQAAAIADGANPFPTIADELMEHPSNSGPVVTYVPSNLTTTIEALTNFVPVADTDILPGSASAILTGSIDRGVGDEVLGKVDKNWIVEWRALPDNYMIGTAQGAGPFVAMREHPETELQGLIVEAETPQLGLTKTQMIRYAGFGAANRIAACVYRIGNAAYAIPTGYDPPLHV